MSSFRRLAFAFCAAPLALGLAACGSDDEGAEAAEAVAPVAAPAGQEWFDVVAITPEGGWLAGNPEAPIRLVEYGSLTCPACASFSMSGMQKLREEYVNSGRVSYELRSVPLHGAIDLILTRLLECAPKEAAHPLAEQIWANLQAVTGPVYANQAAIEQAMSLPENQRFVAFADRGGLLDFFAARGVSRDQATQCLSNAPAITALAERLQAQSDKDQVTGTPTFFLNGNRVDEINWEPIEAALQRAGAR
jgi:protein-disulfide isomerase